jgi:hypothetical protein
MLADCRGVILDVGPGAGEQLGHFKRLENITAIYGAEPGVDLHAVLRENANATPPPRLPQASTDANFALELNTYTFRLLSVS